jgi:hypothetical protein
MMVSCDLNYEQVFWAPKASTTALMPVQIKTAAPIHVLDPGALSMSTYFCPQSTDHTAPEHVCC